MGISLRHISYVAAIAQEEDIPSSEDSVKKWIDNPRVYNNHILFSMHIEAIVKPKYIRDKFVPWMQRKESFIELDKLDARKVYGVGFITDLHPNSYNRMNLKSFIQQELKKQ